MVEIKNLEKIVNYITYIVALAFVLVGIGILYRYNLSTEDLLKQIAGSLIIIGLVSLIWQLIVQRAFLNEILGKIDISKNLHDSGIVEVTDNFHNIDFKPFFDPVNEIDLFFIYGYTWLNHHRSEFINLSSNDNVKIRVILPDNDKDELMEELSRRFGNNDPELIKSNIQHVIDEFKRMFKDGKAKIEIWKLSVNPLFTFYKFDNKIILALYSHKKEKSDVPSFVIKKKGLIYDFISKEIESMVGDGGRAEIIYKN